TCRKPVPESRGGSSRTTCWTCACCGAAESTTRPWISAGTGSRWPPSPRRSRGSGDDDSVVVAVEDVAGHERHPAQVDRDIALTGAGFGALARIGAERLDPDVDVAQPGGVAYRAVHDEPGPAVAAGQLGDDIADQCGMQRTGAVDHQHCAVAGFGEHRFHQSVVLETAHGADRSGELATAPELVKLDVTTAHGVADVVDQVGGGPECHGHRFSGVAAVGSAAA